MACLKGAVVAVVTLLRCGASVIPRTYGDSLSHYGALLDRHDTPENVEYLQTILDRAFHNQCSLQAQFDRVEVLDSKFCAELDLRGPELIPCEPEHHETRQNKGRVMISARYLRNSSMPTRENLVSTSPGKQHRFRQESNHTPIKNNSQRRGRLNHPQNQEDSISPAESISIASLEQLLPKPHKCSKGEDCPKWKKQRRKLQRLLDDFCVDPSLESSQLILEEPDGHDTSGSEDLQPVSDVEPSLVTSSDVLGPSSLPQFDITAERLKHVSPRDPQENVQQFLSFQHLSLASPASVLSLLPIDLASLAPAPSVSISQTIDGANWI